MTQVECYFSVMSPYSYLAMPDLARIAAGVGIRYMPLHFGALAQRMGSILMTEATGPRKRWYHQDLPRQAARRGLVLNIQPAFWPGNAAPASYAIIAAQDQGGDVDGLVQTFCRALWAEDRDIADDHVVRECLAAHGFDADWADRRMFMAAERYAQNL